VFTGVTAFFIMWSGQLLSTLGSGLTGWGLGVLVYRETGSTMLFVLNMVCYVLPTIVLAPLAGVATDRTNRRWILILADAIAGLGTLSILIALLSGKVEVWHIYLVTALGAAANTFQWPASSAATTTLVPKEQLGRAGGLSQVEETLAQLVTPGLAGVLFVTVGMRGIILIDLATMTLAILSLLTIAIPMPEKISAPGGRLDDSRLDGSQKESFWHELTFGWRYLAKRPGLFGLLVYFAIGNFFVNAAYSVFTPMLLNLTSPDVLGYVGSIGGIGMATGTVLMSAWGGPKNRRVAALLIADALSGLATAAAGLRPSIPLITAMNFMMMFFTPFSNGNSQAMWQIKVAPDVQGRVFSVRRMIAYSIIPFAYLTGGFLSGQVFEPALQSGGALSGSLGRLIGVGPGRGSGLLLLVMGLLWAVSALVTLLLPRVRRLEAEIPDAAPEFFPT